MRRDAPSLSVEPPAFDWLTFARRACAFERFVSPGGAAIFILHAPHFIQQGDASASDVAMIARLYGVPASVLMAVASWLRAALDRGETLSDIPAFEGTH